MAEAVLSRAVQRHALPERPNLEFLRNEAKVRLKTLRVSDPTAQLSEAQKEVARKYGFASWRRLRAEVGKLTDQTGAESAEDKVERLKAEQGLPRKAVAIDPMTLDQFVGFYQLAPERVSTHPAWAAAVLFRRAAVDFDGVTEAFDSELGEGHGSVRVLRIVDPDQPVFGLQIGSDIGEPVGIFAEFPCDERQGPDGMDLVDVHREQSKPGSAKPGHEGHSRVMSEDPDVVVDHRPDRCACCGGRLRRL